MCDFLKGVVGCSEEQFVSSLREYGETFELNDESVKYEKSGEVRLNENFVLFYEVESGIVTLSIGFQPVNCDLVVIRNEVKVPL